VVELGKKCVKTSKSYVTGVAPSGSVWTAKR